MADSKRTTTRPGGRIWPRWISLLVGVWLIISAFMWPHTPGQRTTTWLVGGLVVLASIWGMYIPRARALNAALSIGLLFATLVLRYASPATRWNNIIAAIILFVVSFIPGSKTPTTTGGPPAINEARRPSRHAPA